MKSIQHNVNKVNSTDSFTFRNASTVLDFPAVNMTSLACMCSKACPAMLSALEEKYNLSHKTAEYFKHKSLCQASSNNYYM